MSKNSGKGLGRIANHKSNLNARIVSSFKLVPNKPKRPCQFSGDWNKDKLALLITDL